MKIEDVMTRRVVAARSDTDLSHVARLMWDNDCGSVPVVDAEDKVVGMLTDRDLCMSANFSGKPLRELRASGCMASEIVTCRASDALGAVAKLMGVKKVRRVPVTDDGGRLIGLVSVGDLVRAAAAAPAKDRKTLHAALLDALTAICARPATKEIAPAPPAKKGAPPAAKSARSNGKKRAKV
jgi:CBS-domain-containing membrane protein